MLAAAGAAAVSGAPPWSVHLGTVVETRFHLALPRWRDGDPWPLSRALAELNRLGAMRTESARTLGSGRGMPLLSAQQLAWHGMSLYLEVRGADGGAEAVVELPGWDEVIAAAPDEDAVWELVDVAAAALDAGSGVIVDGEAPAPGGIDARCVAAALRRHLGVLVAEGSGDAGASACRYRVLHRSGLEVLLR